MASGVAVKFEEMRRGLADRPHGTRQRYVGGCRCVPCRAANSRYETERAVARAAGDWNGVVSAAQTRQHIERLSAAGVGGKALAAASGISYTIIQLVKHGHRKQVRRRTEARILSVDGSARSDGALVPSDQARRMIEHLVDEGYSKAQLARWLGYQRPALQFFRSKLITARTASRVERMVVLLRAGRLRRDR